MHGKAKESAEAQHAMQLLHMARADIDSVLKELGTHPDGLSEAEAHARLKQYGEQ